MSAESINLRKLSLETLLAAEKSDGKATALIKADLEKIKELPKNQRSFYNRLTKGTLEQQIRLDYILSFYLTKPVSKLKPPLRWILRLSVYQIYEMQSIPQSAVVNEAVKLASLKGFSSMKGLINGVLRNVIRDPARVKQPSKSDPVKYISVMYSMPEYLVSKWIGDYGAEAAEKICAAFLKERPIVIRLKTGGCSPDATLESLRAEGVSVRIPDGAPDGAAEIADFGALNRLSAFKNGSIYVQDTGSQLAVAFLELGPGMTILDLCAAPGGKSMTAADRAGESSLVTARDVNEEKTALIDENIKRCGFANIKTETADASVFNENDVEKYDVVIADLPCSGYGVIGRKPDVKYHASKEKEDALVSIQRSILMNAVRYVKPGGQLLFSTCTLSKKENEENAAFISSEYGLKNVCTKTLLPGINADDGFFISVFRKEK